jgi:hypothetical protein
VENPQSPVLGMMDVRYVLSGLQETEIPSTLPRFRLVSKIRVARSMQEAAAMLRSPDFKPAEEAIIEGGFLGSYSPGAAPGTVKVAGYGLQSVELKTSSATPQYLVTSETNYPGWQAWVDGRPEPVYYTNVAFRGLWVPAGSHTVTMRFAPAVLPYLAAVSGGGWLIWLALWWLPSGWRPTAAQRLPEPRAA